MAVTKRSRKGAKPMTEGGPGRRGGGAGQPFVPGGPSRGGGGPRPSRNGPKPSTPAAATPSPGRKRSRK
jgi:hypothetical protein